MKAIAALVISLITTGAFAERGQPIDDQAVFDSIRERYDGLWAEEASSENLFGETLKNGKILVELADKPAELVFLSLPLAAEKIQYIPSEGGASYSNYFIRLGPSIDCGLGSKDLKKDRFPDFKCRLTVDAQGNILPFLDRTARTSNQKPLDWLGKFEKDAKDFLWRSLTEIKSIIGVYSTRQGPRVVGAGTSSVSVQVHGDLAMVLYDKLDLPTVGGFWGPETPYLKKTGKQIWCLKLTKEENNAKCRITFDYTGKALPGKDI